MFAELILKVLSTLRAKPILLSNLLGEIHPKYYIVILGMALKDYLRQSFSTSFKQVQNDFQSLYVIFIFKYSSVSPIYSSFY